MDLSVVIPTYNQAELLRACLARLLDQSLPAEAFEIIVVDDGSTDATPAVVEATGPRVRAIRFPSNRGRSAARNAGIAAARAPVIVFIDSDVLVRRDFLQRHLAIHRRYGPDTLSRGPVVSVPDAASVGAARIPRIAASPAYLDTANAAVDRAALQRVGMFDEAFPGYGWEDFELGVRLRRAGVRRIFDRGAAAFHIQPALQPGDVPALLQKEEARARSAVYFFRKVPTAETRLLIQATPFHRLLYWLVAAGGRLSGDAAAQAARRLERRGWRTLGYLALRAALNYHYVQTLAREMRLDAPAVA
jgi:glycosyltransferase involved in cell wall biosynthesis